MKRFVASSIVVLGLCGGCDSLFDIDHVNKLDAANVADVRMVDARDMDAPLSATYFVQGNGESETTARQTVSVMLVSPVHHGDIVVVEVCSSGESIVAGVGDDEIDSYASEGGVSEPGTTFVRALTTFYTVVKADQATLTVTVTFTGSVIYSSVQVAEYTGVVTAIEDHASAQTSSSMTLPVAVTVPNGPSLLVATACANNEISSISDFSLRASAPQATLTATIADKAVIGPGPASAVVETVPPGDAILATLLAFKGI